MERPDLRRRRLDYFVLTLTCAFLDLNKASEILPSRNKKNRAMTLTNATDGQTPTLVNVFAAMTLPLECQRWLRILWPT